VDFSKLSREDLMVGGGGLLLLIGLLAFPWFSVSYASVGSYTAVATDSTGGIWAILALIILFAVIVDLGLARFSPETVLPTSKFGRELTRSFAVALIVLLMLIRVIAHTGNWGWGFFVDLILLAVVAVGAWFNAQGRATPVSTRPAP
jgi:hypothetical protein